jgi:hypothetical protein
MNAITGHAVGTTTIGFMSGLEALWKCKDVTSVNLDGSSWVAHA